MIKTGARDVKRNTHAFISVFSIIFLFALAACGSGGGGDSQNQAPTAEITGGASIYTVFDDITFTGTGTDPEDGVLTGTSLQWTSDLDGSIGIGETFSTSLSEGMHIITLMVTDFQGASDSAISTETVASLWSTAVGGNDHSYLAIAEQSYISWTDADSNVQTIGNGWYLATITSQAENDFVYSLVSGDPQYWYCCTGGSSGHGPWLGGVHVGPGVGDYEWVTGEPFVYTNWAPSEPFGNGQRIAFFGYQTTMGPQWNDIGPDRPGAQDVVSYIMEKE